MSAQHTPGPWATTAMHDGSWWIHGEETIDDPGEHIAEVRSEGNASLIAAAPQMAEALCDLLRVCADWEFFGGERVAREAARAALAAAGVES